MYRQKSYLLNLIEAAFKDVTLEDGVSLHEADVIDNYGSAEERLAARRPDEKEDWHRLDKNELERMPWVLSFYDAKGLHFHLPAYLTMAVEDHTQAAVDSLLFTLCYESEYNHERLSILSKRQRKAVRHVLKFVRHNTGRDYEWDHTRIDQALRGFWAG